MADKTMSEEADEGGKLYPNPESVPLSEQPTAPQAPQPQVVDQRYAKIQPGSGDWSTGPAQCTVDLKICLLSYCCPVCYGMKLSTEMDESIITPCLVPSWFAGLRQKMRLQQGIPGSLLGDCAMEMCCFPCGLSQLGREIKIRQAHGLMPSQQNEPSTQGMNRQ